MCHVADDICIYISKARANDDQRDLRLLLLFEVVLGNDDQSLALAFLRDGYALDQIYYDAP